MFDTFRKQAPEPESDGCACSCAHAIRLLQEMGASCHLGYENKWTVYRELRINGMDIKEEGRNRDFCRAILACHVKFEEAKRMGAIPK